MNVILIILVFLFFLSKSKKEKETRSLLKVVLYIDMEVDGVPLKLSRWWNISLEEPIHFRAMWEH